MLKVNTKIKTTPLSNKCKKQLSKSSKHSSSVASKTTKKTTKPIFTTTSLHFSKKSTKKKLDAETSSSEGDSSDLSSSESSESSEDANAQSTKGPMMPELYRLSTQLDAAFGSYYKRNVTQLSTISQRMVDKNGLFLRTSPPILNLLPEYYEDKKIDSRVLYMQKGDVEVFFAPISQPDDVSRNAKMIDGLLENFDFDNVVIPLSAKPKKLRDLDNPFEFVHLPALKYDIFDPEGAPEPPKIVSGAYGVVETPQYAAYKAYEKNLDISLSGRLEFVSFNNFKYKLSLHTKEFRGMLFAGNPTNQQISSEVNCTLLPHAASLSPIAEASFNFEPALVATATIRASIEEQQRNYQSETTTHNKWVIAKSKFNKYKKAIEDNPDHAHTLAEVVDPGQEPPRPLSKRVLAVIDTAQLRHFENTFDLIDVLSSADFAYLKRGFEAYFRESKTPTLGKRLKSIHTEKAITMDLGEFDSDSSDSSEDETKQSSEHRDDPRHPSTVLSTPGSSIFPKIAAQRFSSFKEIVNDLPTATKPFISIHRLFTAIYGPVADTTGNSCGRCQFDYDEMGFYTSQKHCQSPKLMSRIGLAKKSKNSCSKKFDWLYNPEALRFPPFDSDPTFNETLTSNLFREWMALRHGLVSYEADIDKRGDSMYLDDIMRVRETITKILSGHVRQYPTQIVRESDLERNKANSRYINALQGVEYSDSGDDLDADDLSGSDDDSEEKKEQSDDEKKEEKKQVKKSSPSTSSKFKNAEGQLQSQDTIPASSQPQETTPQSQQPIFSQEIPLHMTSSPTEQYKQSKPVYNDFRKVTDKEPHNQSTEAQTSTITETETAPVEISPPKSPESKDEESKQSKQ